MSEIREGGKPERELIIEKILKEKRRITLQEARDRGQRFDCYTREYPGVDRYLLEYGGKILIITIDMVKDPDTTDNDGEVNTFVSNISDAEHKNGETTTLYAAARRLIEEECVDTNKKLRYVLETNNPKMIAWAQTAGRQIFNWDTERVQASENYIVTGIHCEKQFIPLQRK